MAEGIRTPNLPAASNAAAFLVNEDAGGGVLVTRALPANAVKAAAGLGNVDNTADLDKPVSSEQATALANKLEKGLHTISIPATGMVPRTTAGAAAGTVETTTNKRMLKTLDFDKDTAEYAQVMIAMPKSWDKGAFTARVDWTPADATAGNVVWAIRAAVIDAADATDHLDRGWGTAVSAISAAPGNASQMAAAAIAAVTPAGTAANNAILSVEIYRDAAAGTDTYAADAQMLAIQLFVTISAVTDA